MSEKPPIPHMSDAPADWQSALAELLAARAELIRYESQDVARVVAKKARFTAMLALFGGMGWLLLMASLVGTVAHFFTIPWWQSSGILALVHLLFSMVVWLKLRQPTPPAFPITKQEFHRDRLWMQSFKIPKSKP